MSRVPACAGMEDVMFPDAEDSSSEAYADAVEYAKSFCDICPIKRECLVKALQRGEKHGVWGGTSEEDRAVLLRELRVMAKKERAA